jgi:ATP-dependent Clp protease ATP-binding subunit ClpC
LAERYITDREFPDKAIDILDEVGARSQVEIKMPEIIEDLKAQAAEIKQQKIQVVKSQKYEEAADLRDRERKILTKLEDEKKKFELELLEKKKQISIELVYEVVSNMTKIPLSKLSLDDSKSLINLEETLSGKVIGQEDAVKRISKAIRRNRLGIKDPNKPIGSFIFLGSTGVGKTYLAKQLAKEIFGSDESLIRVDMSEYQEKHSISKLIGAPPGYVGYDQGGQLTEQIKNKPYCVILFDEIEKANKDVFSSLLQVLDDGHLTDGLGRKINFKNCLIIMTSNLGIKKLQEFGAGVGFSTSQNSFAAEENRKNMLQKEMKNFFSPEFLNRIDDIVIFNSLKENEIEKIASIELTKLQNRLSEMKYDVSFDENIVKYISKNGFDELYGARPLKRAIQDKLEDFISDEVLKGTIVEGGSYSVSIKDDNVVLETREEEVKEVKKGRKKKGE